MISIQFIHQTTWYHNLKASHWKSIQEHIHIILNSWLTDYLKDIIVKSNYYLWKINISVKKSDTIFNMTKDTEKPM